MGVKKENSVAKWCAENGDNGKSKKEGGVESKRERKSKKERCFVCLIVCLFGVFLFVADPFRNEKGRRKGGREHCQTNPSSR